MKRLEEDGANIMMKEVDRDMIQVFTNETQIKGLEDVDQAINEDH